MLGNGIYVSTSIGVTDGVQWTAPCKAECHLIDKEGTEESFARSDLFSENIWLLRINGRLSGMGFDQDISIRPWVHNIGLE